MTRHVASIAIARADAAIGGPSHGAARWTGGMLALVRAFLKAAFDPYRPELHYMRGPGPAWRARHGVQNRRSL